uniref:Uncharacterized protein n=1 Tax=Cyprinus carpio TaxID=7962 RepID=A0A8C1YHZ1_CYPCA
MFKLKLDQVGKQYTWYLLNVPSNQMLMTTSKNFTSVGTQWEDHIFEEHCYIQGPHRSANEQVS